jgi:hypothetical protein
MLFILNKFNLNNKWNIGFSVFWIFTLKLLFHPIVVGYSTGRKIGYNPLRERKGRKREERGKKKLRREKGLKKNRRREE